MQHTIECIARGASDFPRDRERGERERERENAPLSSAGTYGRARGVGEESPSGFGELRPSAGVGGPGIATGSPRDSGSRGFRWALRSSAKNRSAATGQRTPVYTLLFLFPDSRRVYTHTLLDAEAGDGSTHSPYPIGATKGLPPSAPRCRHTTHPPPLRPPLTGRAIKNVYTRVDTTTRSLGFSRAFSLSLSGAPIGTSALRPCARVSKRAAAANVTLHSRSHGARPLRTSGRRFE
jgi:hypothetical protein